MGKRFMEALVLASVFFTEVATNNNWRKVPSPGGIEGVVGGAV
jgi:hypothetical protein